MLQVKFTAAIRTRNSVFCDTSPPDFIPDLNGIRCRGRDLSTCICDEEAASRRRCIREDETEATATFNSIS